MRPSLMGAYGAAGFRPDDFARSSAARRLVADLLTRAEDSAELRGARREHAAIRVVRRALEAEVWP